MLHGYMDPTGLELLMYLSVLVGPLKPLKKNK